MPYRIVLSRFAASALAIGAVADFTTVAQAQPEVETTLMCKYIDVTTEDPLGFGEDVTDAFPVPVFAVEGNSDMTELKKASGPAEVTFAVADDDPPITSGMFFAEVDAKLKDLETLDGLFGCANSARVRGNGYLVVSEAVQTEAEVLSPNWVIRDSSRLDGSKVSAYLGTGEDDVEGCPGDVGSPCSVHRVKASLKITAQGEKGNGDLKYERSTLNQKDIFEAYEGARPEKGQDLVLVCGCVDLPDVVVVEPDLEAVE